MCGGREHLGTWKAFLKKLIIYIYKKVNYIYIKVQVSVCWKEKKKIEQNLFFKEKESFDKERKNQFKQGKFFNSKVLKFWVLLDKVPSHF